MMNNLIKNKKHILGLLLGLVLGCIMFYAGVINTFKFVVVLGVLRFMFYKPINAMMIYIMAIPIVSDFNIVVLSLLVIMIYIIGFIKKGSFKIKYTPVNIPILIFTICIVTGTIFSVSMVGSIRDFAINILSIVILLLFVNTSHDEDDIVLVSKSFVFIAVLLCFYGLYQFKTGVAMGSGWVDPTQSPEIKTRIFATFENPNIFAEYLIMIMPLGVSLVLRKSEGTFNKLCYLGCIGLILLNILLTYSRAGWLAMAFSFVALVTLVDIKKLIYLMPLGLGSILIMPTWIIQRVMTISLQDSSIFYRYKVFTLAIEMFKDYWYSGVGLGYKSFMKMSPFYIKTMAPYHTHNTYLQIGIELGIVGLVAFLLIAFNLVRMSIKTLSKTKDMVDKIFYASYMAGLSGVFLHGLAEHVLYHPKIIFVFWIFIGVNIRLYLIKNTSQQECKDIQ